MSSMGGQLDIDVIEPNRDMPGRPSVENITWADRSRMKPGVYKFFVHQYTARGIIGFSMTKRAELIVKVKGATERIMKVRF